MMKAFNLIKTHWKPLAALAATGAASYFGGPAAGAMVQELLTKLLG